MSSLMTAPPFSAVAPVTEVIHGVSVTDPYRWLEDSGSPETRRWIEQQTQYARAYLDRIPGRDVIRKRIREFLAVETYDSLQMAGNRYFFRKRLPDQEQPCIYMREGADGLGEGRMREGSNPMAYHRTGGHSSPDSAAYVSKRLGHQNVCQRGIAADRKQWEYGHRDELVNAHVAGRRRKRAAQT